MRILVVEDDAKIAAFVEAGLEAAGFAVDAAADGERGLALALATPYDCAVVDVMLPGLDGLALIRALRARGVRTPAPPSPPPSRSPTSNSTSPGAP